MLQKRLLEHRKSTCCMKNLRNLLSAGATHRLHHKAGGDEEQAKMEGAETTPPRGRRYGRIC
jgi:hypothetical protein